MKEETINWKTTLVYGLFIAFVLAAGSAYGQVEVIEFNAAFNAGNGCEWVDELTDCEVSHVDIMDNQKAQKKYKIVVVPTILVLKDGEEVIRFQANIMMQMEATIEEVQEAVDNEIMSDF